MNAPPTYRALARREEQRRIAERESAGKCIACGVNDRMEGSLLCVDHRTDLDRQSAHTRDLAAPLPPPLTTPRLDAHVPPSSRRRGAP